MFCKRIFHEENICLYELHMDDDSYANIDVLNYQIYTSYFIMTDWRMITAFMLIVVPNLNQDAHTPPPIKAIVPVSLCVVLLNILFS